uniref:Uncharacterized protein n=1 Tax=Hommersandiophycus borowitzkae TaxID=268573 RepID=A0A1G4NTX6_9FLOR|nr:Hypothetical protein ORF_2 [Hommersandiophycus borowitzkae]SCW22132.1 Hypothetical protein ORF_2 [Hommersandiophycus borowitzkae]
MSFISYLNTLNHSFSHKTFRVSTCTPGHKMCGYQSFSNDLQFHHRTQSLKLIFAAESFYRFSKLHNTNTQLFYELLNKYWGQTIFLSNSNPVIQKYSSLLAKQDIVLLKSNKKKLISAITKALQYGEIYTDIGTKLIDRKSYVPNGAIRYFWAKGLNIRLPKYFNGFLNSRKSAQFPTQLQYALLQKLQNNNLPIFVLANGFNQMILSEPASELVHSKNIFHKIYLWYYDRFLWSHDNQAVYEGWFFINPKDAEEYEEFVRSRYIRSSNQNGLKVVSTSLHSYYRLNRLAPPRIEFRLFPDLEEVGRLVNSFKYRKGLKFDNRQNYGRQYFQGQPIYFIEPVPSVNRFNGQRIDLHYYYQVPGDSSNQKYAAVFFNKDVALKAWDNFRNLKADLKLPRKPQLRVYNLEDFLKDNETTADLAHKNFLFIPSLESYQSIKSTSLNGHRQNIGISRHISHYKLTASLWCQRLIWSLTSRQPPNW